MAEYPQPLCIYKRSNWSASSPFERPGIACPRSPLPIPTRRSSMRISSRHTSSSSNPATITPSVDTDCERLEVRKTRSVGLTDDLERTERILSQLFQDFDDILGISIGDDQNPMSTTDSAQILHHNPLAIYQPRALPTRASIQRPGRSEVANKEVLQLLSFEMATDDQLQNSSDIVFLLDIVSSYEMLRAVTMSIYHFLSQMTQRDRFAIACVDMNEEGFQILLPLKSHSLAEVDQAVDDVPVHTYTVSLMQGHAIRKAIVGVSNTLAHKGREQASKQIRVLTQLHTLWHGGSYDLGTIFGLE